jgi:hypothetical protein
MVRRSSDIGEVLVRVGDDQGAILILPGQENERRPAVGFRVCLIRDYSMPSIPDAVRIQAHSIGFLKGDVSSLLFIRGQLEG